MAKQVTIHKERKERRHQDGDPTAFQPDIHLPWVSDVPSVASVPDPAPSWDIGSFDGGDTGGGGGGSDF